MCERGLSINGLILVVALAGALGSRGGARQVGATGSPGTTTSSIPSTAIASPGALISEMASRQVYFVKNEGQLNPEVMFAAKIPNGNAYYDARGMTYQFLHKTDDSTGNAEDPAQEEGSRNSGLTLENIRVSFIGSRPDALVEGIEASQAPFSYFSGTDTSKWVRGAAGYQKLSYQGLYPGVDLVVSSSQGKLKNEYMVAPGAEVGVITLRYEGAGSLCVNAEGQLEISTPAGVLVEEAPVSYQIIDNQKVDVASRYSVDKHNTVGFIVPEYRRDRPLVIDPALVYSSYFGGNGDDTGRSLAIDLNGNVYVTGETYSDDLPTSPGAYDVSLSSAPDAFVCKIDPSGSTLIFSTYIGGANGGDYGQGIAVDRSGFVYVAGWTVSADFPTTAGAYDGTLGGSPPSMGDGFVTKLDPTGTSLVYSTFLGGSDDDICRGIAVDASGKAYVTGKTSSPDFPATPGAYDTTPNGDRDIFVTCVNPSGTQLSYSTLIGGNSTDSAYAIVLDQANQAYVTGLTNSADLPTTPGAYDNTLGGARDVFVAAVNSAGSGLPYCTYLGGSKADEARGVAVDASGNAYLAGFTYSTDFPTTAGAYDTSANGGSDAFVSKLDPTGSALVYSTYLGGAGPEQGRRIAVDRANNPVITGFTTSNNFPTTAGAYDTTYNTANSNDIYLTVIEVASSTLIYSTYLGAGGTAGGAGELAYGLGLDPDGNACVAGSTDSAAFPTTAGAYDRSANGGFDAFVCRLLLPTIYPIFDGSDFNADLKSDIAVWRRDTGQWYIKDQSSQSWGRAGDIPVCGDYDGNGSTDVAVWKPSNGIWYIKDQTNVTWGRAGDIPVPGDYDAGGTTDIAVFRPSTGQWFIKDQVTVTWGRNGDIPVPGDYNKDGKTDIAVWRPSAGRWFIKDQVNVDWGRAGDVPVPGDYNADTKTDIAVWRPSTGGWFIKDQPTVSWGKAGDVPVPGDYNGDSKTDIAVWRSTNGTWYIKDQPTVVWGQMGDVPLVR